MPDDPPRSHAEMHTASLQQRFNDICRDITTAHTQRDLTALYQRAAYLVKLTHARSWEARLGQEVDTLRTLAQQEFAATIREINQRALQLGLTVTYNEQWRHEP
jgi:hypothetical protein